MADLYLVLVTLLWGTTFGLVKEGLRGASPGALLTVRLGIATLVMAVIAVATPRGRGGDAWRLWRAGGALGILLAAGFVLQTEGLARTTPARAAFFTGLTVLLVPFVAAVIYRRRMTGRAWAAAAVAATGLALLTHPAARLPLVATVGGDLLSLLCAFAFAFHIVFTGAWSDRHPLVPLTAVEIATAFATVSAYALARPFQLSPSPGLWAILVFLGAGMTAAAFLLQNWCQRRVNPVRAALIFTLEPLVAALFAWAWRGDRLTPLEAAGGGLVIAGVLVGEVGAALAARRRASGLGGAAGQ